MFDDFGKVFSSIIGAGASLFGNRMRAVSAERAYRMQYEQSLDFWNRQNAYNHPAAQMRRFQEAGLNPHLIYGQSNMSGPISAAPAPNPDVKDINFLDGLFKYQDLKNGEAQHELINAQKDFAVQQAENAKFGREMAEKNYMLGVANQELNRSLIEEQKKYLAAKTRALTPVEDGPDDNMSFLETVGEGIGSVLSVLGFKNASKYLTTKKGREELSGNANAISNYIKHLFTPKNGKSPRIPNGPYNLRL